MINTTDASSADQATSHQNRHPQLLDATQSHLVVIDVQGKFVPAMSEMDETMAAIHRLVDAATVCEVPRFVTQQCTLKLEGTVPELAKKLGNPLEKSRFSAAAALQFGRFGSIEAPSARPQIVLCGIETHVCVLQTAFDLLANGWQPYVVSDACTSRSRHNHSAAVARLLHNGVSVVTTEMVLFEWVEDARRPPFKAISRLVK